VANNQKNESTSGTHEPSSQISKAKQSKAKQSKAKQEPHPPEERKSPVLAENAEDAANQCQGISDLPTLTSSAKIRARERCSKFNSRVQEGRRDGSSQSQSQSPKDPAGSNMYVCIGWKDVQRADDIICEISL
jgi:hypothetical protein